MIPWQTNAKYTCITIICTIPQEDSQEGGIDLKHQGNSQLSESLIESIPLQN